AGWRTQTGVRRRHLTAGAPAPAHAARQSSCACRKLSGTGTPAHWPAGGSCPQCCQHHAQGYRVYSGADAQPLPAGQYQFQTRFARSLLPRRSSLHQRETHRLLLLPQSLAPVVKQMLSDALCLTVPPHTYSTALLLGDPFAPLIFVGGRFLLVVRFSHATTMQPFPIYWEEEFIGRLHSLGGQPTQSPTHLALGLAE